MDIDRNTTPLDISGNPTGEPVQTQVGPVLYLPLGRPFARLVNAADAANW
jgi:hypothetical protein